MLISTGMLTDLAPTSKPLSEASDGDGLRPHNARVRDQAALLRMGRRVSLHVHVWITRIYVLFLK